MAFRLSIRRAMLLAGTLGTLTAIRVSRNNSLRPALPRHPQRKPPRSIRSRCRPARR